MTSHDWDELGDEYHRASVAALELGDEYHRASVAALKAGWYTAADYCARKAEVCYSIGDELFGEFLEENV